jgi:hypothetical protein
MVVPVVPRGSVPVGAAFERVGGVVSSIGLTVTVTVSLAESAPSFAVRRSEYVPLVENDAVVSIADALPNVTVPGPLTIDHVVVSVPAGNPSSVTVPSRFTTAGKVIVWLVPASTTGAWFAAFTVRLKAVPRVVPPDVPLTVIGYVPVGVLISVVIVIVEVHDVDGVQLVGVKDAPAPLGRPVAENETVAAVPDVRVTVMMLVILLPCTTDLFPS